MAISVREPTLNARSFPSAICSYRNDRLRPVAVHASGMRYANLASSLVFIIHVLFDCPAELQNVEKDRNGGFCRHKGILFSTSEHYHLVYDPDKHPR